MFRNLFQKNTYPNSVRIPSRHKTEAKKARTIKIKSIVLLSLVLLSCVIDALLSLELLLSIFIVLSFVSLLEVGDLFVC